jgi:hypothetical protein
MINIV